MIHLAPKKMFHDLALFYNQFVLYHKYVSLPGNSEYNIIVRLPKVKNSKLILKLQGGLVVYTFTLHGALLVFTLPIALLEFIFTLHGALLAFTLPGAHLVFTLPIALLEFIFTLHGALLVFTLQGALIVLIFICMAGSSRVGSDQF